MHKHELSGPIFTLFLLSILGLSAILYQFIDDEEIERFKAQPEQLRQQRKDNYASQTSRVPKDTSKKRSTTEDAQQLPQKATGTSGANAEGDTKSKVTPKTKVVPTSKEKTARDKNQAPSSRGSTVKTSNKSKKKSRSKRTNRKKPKLEEIQFD